MNQPPKNAKTPKRDSISALSAFSEVKNSGSQSDYFATSAPPRILHQIADVIPTGGGEFRIVTKKPKLEPQEISTLQAAKLLGLGITATKALRDSKLGQRYIRWRYTTENRKVLRWELPSMLAY